MKLIDIVNPQEFIDRINQKLPPREWVSGDVSVKEGFYGVNVLPAYFVSVRTNSSAVTIALNVGWWGSADKASQTMDASRAFRQIMNMVQAYGVTADTEFVLQEPNG